MTFKERMKLNRTLEKNVIKENKELNRLVDIRIGENNFIKGNNMENNNTTGIGLASLTFLVFLVLKLVNVINWSWWWVTAPLWGSVALVVILYLLIFLLLIRKDYSFRCFFKKIKFWQRKK